MLFFYFMEVFCSILHKTKRYALLKAGLEFCALLDFELPILYSDTVTKKTALLPLRIRAFCFL